MRHAFLRGATVVAVVSAVFSAFGAPSVQARRLSAPVATTVAYIYDSNIALRDSFKVFLELRGFGVAPVSLAEAETFDFGKIDVILIGDDTGNAGSPFTWRGGRVAVSRILSSEKPIVSLGNGAQYFDAHSGLLIGWGPSWIATQFGAIAANPADAIWTAPHAVPLASDDAARLYLCRTRRWLCTTLSRRRCCGLAASSTI